MTYYLNLAIVIEIYILLALSLNLAVGYGGLLLMCHAAFYGVGAYLGTLLVLGAGVGFVPAAVGSVAGTVALSLLVSWASLRFRGDHFVVAGLAFQIIVYSALYNWTSVTNGSFGISQIPRPTIAGYQFDSLPQFFILCSVVTLIVSAGLVIVYRSCFALTLQAVRDDELAAASLGKSVISFKMRSVAIAAGCASVAGLLLATFATYIDPTSFNTEQSILLVSMIIVGGTGNVWGPIAGVIALTLFPELLRVFSIPDPIAADLRVIIYGLLLVVVMRFRPQGLLGKYRFN